MHESTKTKLKKEAWFLGTRVLTLGAFLFPFILGMFFISYLGIPYFRLPTGKGIVWDILTVLGNVFVSASASASGAPVLVFSWAYVASIISSLAAYGILRKKWRGNALVIGCTLVGALVLYICICYKIVYIGEAVENLRLIRIREGAEITQEVKIGTCLVWLITFIASYMAAYCLYAKIYLKKIYAKYLRVYTGENEEGFSAERKDNKCIRLGKCLLVMSMCLLLSANFKWLSNVDKMLTWDVVQGKVERVEKGHVWFSYKWETVRVERDEKSCEYHQGDVVKLLCKKHHPEDAVEYTDGALFGEAYKWAKMGRIGVLLSLWMMVIGWVGQRFLSAKKHRAIHG